MTPPTQVVDMLYNELKSTAGEITKARGLKGWGALIPTLIFRVEQLREAGAGLSGPDKKWVAVATLNRLINLPVVPEFIEEKIFGMAVDWFVDFFNRSYGKKWEGIKLPF